MKVGDVISPASNDAFEACRFGLERLKKMASLKKTELLWDQGRNLS